MDLFLSPRSVRLHGRRVVALFASLLVTVGFQAAALGDDNTAAGSANGESAAEDGEIHIYTALASADSVLADLELFVKKLAGHPDVFDTQVSENIEIFLFGLARDQPVRFDTILGNAGEPRLNMMVPIADEKEFRLDNLEPIGINPRKKSEGVYQLRGDVYEGVLKYALPTDPQYGVFAFEGFETDADVTLDEILDRNAKLLAHGYTARALIDESSGPIASRAKIVATMQSKALDELSKRPDETADAFTLRKLLTEQRYDRLAVLLSGGSHLSAGYKTDQDTNISTFAFRVVPEDETELHESIAGISATPAAFANVPTIDDPVVTARLAVPMYAARQARVKAMLEASRPVSLAEVKLGGEPPVKQDAQLKLTGLIYDHLIASLDQPILSLFYEVHAAKTGHNVAIGVSTPAGDNVEAILDAMPAAIGEFAIEREVEKIGDVVIHKVSLPEMAAPLKKHLGGVTDGYIGVAKDATYFAGGPAGLELLKTSLADLEAGTTNTAASIRMHAAPMAELLDEVMTTRDFSVIRFLQDRREERIEEKERDPNDVRRVQAIDPSEWRQAALQALVEKAGQTPDDDLIVGTIDEKDGELIGDVALHSAILAAVGELIAKFAEENL